MNRKEFEELCNGDESFQFWEYIMNLTVCMRIHFSPYPRRYQRKSIWFDKLEQFNKKVGKKWYYIYDGFAEIKTPVDFSDYYKKQKYRCRTEGFQFTFSHMGLFTERKEDIIELYDTMVQLNDGQYDKIDFLITL